MPLTAGRSEDALRSLTQAVDEAATVPTLPGRELWRFGTVISALADASLEMRLAYWGYPHPGSVGDQPLVILVDGREFAVSSVTFQRHRIEVDTEPLAPEPTEAS